MNGLDKFLSNTYNLNNCDKEPVHIPGLIQSFGCLVIASNVTKLILAVSENIERLGFKKEDLVGSPLLAFFDNEKILNSKIDDLFLRDVSFLGKNYCLTKTVNEGFIYIEVLPKIEKKHQISLDVTEVMTQELFFHDIVWKLYSSSDYERVMYYKFDEDYNGEVVAEGKDENLESYLGLHYPASDIPKQVRALFALNPIRVIQDTHDTPIRLYPSTEIRSSKPWNLTPCITRGVSPIHIQYLENMKVRSSMSFSIVNERGRLIGLIAFHSSQPVDIDLSFIETLTTLREKIGNGLPLLEEYENQSGVLRLEEIKTRILIEADKNSLMDDIVLSMILEIGDCEGCIVYEEGKNFNYNIDISKEYLEYMVKTLNDLEEHQEFATRSMILHFSDVLTNLETFSGLYGLKTNKGWLLLFKKEKIEEVNWAGKPEKTDINGTLNPRSSFELWSESVKNTSKSWAPFRRRFLRNIVDAVYR
ncbi:MAG: GAF domain-containing protein [Campylobacterales bacterium]|nr:GAF domain-containing protein [Campylobacterales bacterium]